MVGDDQPYVVAHRAANTIAGLHAAGAAGARLCECDVHLFWGRLEVRHLKTFGPIPILWDRWYLVNPFRRRLLLADLLRSAAPDEHLMLDLKGLRSAVGTRVRRALHGHRGTVAVCSRNWRALERLRGLPDVQLIHSVGSARQLRELLRRFGPASLQGVSINAALLTPQVVAQLRERAATVMSWPIRTRAQADRVIAWGVRGLITEHLQVLGNDAP